MTEDYDCHGEICIPKGYNPLDPPINGERDNPFGPGKTAMTWVYFNFLDESDLVKRVDDHKMMITFQAEALMVWDDPRLKIKGKIPGIVPLHDQLRNKIWTPKITIDQPHFRPSSAYKHPATYRKILCNLVHYHFDEN